MALPTADLQFTISIQAEKLKKDTMDAYGRLFTSIGQSFVGPHVQQHASNVKRSGAAFRVDKKNFNQARKEIGEKVKKQLAHIDETSQSALQDVLEQILAKALELTPEDTGLLKSTGFVATERLKTVVRGRVGFNITSGDIPPGVSTGADYAVFVHETYEIYHDPPTQAGFLLEAVNQYKNQIGKMLRYAMGRGAVR